MAQSTKPVVGAPPRQNAVLGSEAPDYWLRGVPPGAFDVFPLHLGDRVKS